MYTSAIYVSYIYGILYPDENAAILNAQSQSIYIQRVILTENQYKIT